MFFILPQNLFSFSRYSNFCFDFLVMNKNGLIRKISLSSNLWPHIKLFSQTKRGLDLIPCLIFYMIFEEKYLSCYILSSDQISVPVCFYFVIVEYVYYNCLLTIFWRHTFWNYPCLSNQTVFSTWPTCL